MLNDFLRTSSQSWCKAGSSDCTLRATCTIAGPAHQSVSLMEEAHAFSFPLITKVILTYDLQVSMEEVTLS